MFVWDAKNKTIALNPNLVKDLSQGKRCPSIETGEITFSIASDVLGERVQSFAFNIMPAKP